MRLESLNESVPRPAYLLKRRLEVLLSLWALPSPWQPRRRDRSFESETIANAWAAEIQNARIVEPVSTRAGLVEALTRMNAAQPGLGWTLATVEQNNVAKVQGERATVRSRIGYAGPTIAGGHAWRLAIQCDESQAESLMPLCENNFALVEYVAGELSFGEPHPRMPEVAVLIARHASGVSEPGILVELWRTAAAFDVVDSWIELLDDKQCHTLAEALSERLKTVASVLDWQTDLAHGAFAEGNDFALSPRTFANRVDECFWAEFMLRQNRLALEPHSVFNEMARTVALAGNAMQVGNLLECLPPGACYFSAVDVLREERPWQIPSLLGHPSLTHHGIVAVADWPDSMVVQGEGSMLLQEEWSEAIGHARRLALVSPGLPSVDAAVALAVHDEGRALSRRGNPYISAPVPGVNARLEPWREFLDKDEHATGVCNALSCRLSADPSGSALAFSLRVLQILDQRFPDQAGLLADAIGRAYTKPFELREPRIPAPQLFEYGGLLAILDRIILRSAGGNANWLTPFEPSAFVEREREGIPAAITSTTVVPSFIVPGLLYQHARHILLAANAAEGTRRHTLVERVVELFEKTSGKTKGWSWREDHETGEPLPLMALLGQALSTPPASDAAVVVERIVDAGATVLHLAQLIWGVGASSPLAKPLISRLRRKAPELLQTGNVARGHANALGVALYRAQQPNLAREFATYVLDSLKGQPPHHVTGIRDTAVRVLLASLAALKKWTEIETIDLDLQDREGKALVENLRAVSDLERQRFSVAINRLKGLLVRAPADATALTNLAASYAALSDWTACRTACTNARSVLADNSPPELSAIEARAHFHLGNFREAAVVLERLPESLSRSPEMIKLRLALATMTTPTMRALEDDLRALSQTDPVTADAIRARLATFSEVELAGGWFAPGTVGRHFPTFEERCAAFRSDEPEGLVVRALAGAAHRMAEQPALVSGLNEDQLTRMLCTLLVPLERLKVYANVFAPGGWGPKIEGLADFAISEMSDDGVIQGRRIVRGEAKHWTGPAWMKKGLTQIFGTGNTGQELFLCLVVYSKSPKFESVAAGVEKALSTFQSQKGLPFATTSGPDRIDVSAGTAVCVFRTEHDVRPGDPTSPRRLLFTVVVDVVSKSSQAVRKPANRAGNKRSAPKSGSKPSAPKPSKARRRR